MAVTADSEPQAGGVTGRRRAAGIYGAIITAAIIAAIGEHWQTLPLAVSIVITLVVYWVAEVYAELLGEHVERGQLPTWRYTRATLAAHWPMVSASYAPLLALVLSRLAGASDATAANVGLVVAVVLLIFHGWSIGRAAKLRGRQLLVVTSIAASLGLLMIVLKDLVLLHLHLHRGFHRRLRVLGDHGAAHPCPGTLRRLDAPLPRARAGTACPAAAGRGAQRHSRGQPPGGCLGGARCRGARAACPGQRQSRFSLTRLWRPVIAPPG